jgi:hypothetical protein
VRIAHAQWKYPGIADDGRHVIILSCNITAHPEIERTYAVVASTRATPARPISVFISFSLVVALQQSVNRAGAARWNSDLIPGGRADLRTLRSQV